MSIFVVATPFRHRGLDIFHIFPVTKALYLLRCRVVAVAKLSNCRVPSSVIFLIFPYRAWARTLFSRSGWPPSPAGGRTESSRQPTIGQRLSMQVFLAYLTLEKKICIFFGLRWRFPPPRWDLYSITQWSCSAPGSLWEMPNSNPGPLPQNSGALPMSHHISYTLASRPFG